MKNYKFLLILAIIILGLILALNANRQNNAVSNQSVTQNASLAQTDSPKIVSTKPEPLEEAIVSANEVLAFTFNKSLENVGEFKVRIEPKVEFKVELSQDRKTAKIIPTIPYELGTGYTLFIGPDTKFDGVGAWGEEKIYHFKTIRYRGV